MGHTLSFTFSFNSSCPFFGHESRQLVLFFPPGNSSGTYPSLPSAMARYFPPPPLPWQEINLHCPLPERRERFFPHPPTLPSFLLAAKNYVRQVLCWPYPPLLGQGMMCLFPPQQIIQPYLPFLPLPLPPFGGP